MDLTSFSPLDMAMAGFAIDIWEAEIPTALDAQIRSDHDIEACLNRRKTRCWRHL